MADLKAYRAFDFGGGLDVNTSPTVLAYSKKNNKLTKANNVIFPTSMGVSKRFDVANANTSTLGAAVQITGGYELRLSSGTNRVVVGTSDGRLVRIDTDGTTTNLATGLTSNTRWSFDQYADILICVNGADAPRKTDGTAGGTTTLGGSPPTTARKVLVHRNHVLLFDATNPTRLTISAEDNPEDYTTANDRALIEIDTKDGGILTDMVSLTNGDAILFKDRSVHRLQGSGFTSWVRLPLTKSSGCLSRAGACTAGLEVFWPNEEGIIALATVIEYGDYLPARISDAIEDYFQPGSSLALSFAALNLAVGVYDRHNRRLMFAFDSNADSKNDLLLVYDLTAHAWSVWPTRVGTTTWSIASLWTVKNATTGIDEVWAGGYDGFARILNRSASTNAIVSTAQHISALGSPGIEKVLRRLYMYFDVESATNIDVQVTADFGTGGGQAFHFNLLNPQTALLGTTFILGVSKLGAQTRIIRRLDAHVIGDVIEVAVDNREAAGDWTWLGYEAHFRERRAIRRGT